MQCFVVGAELWWVGQNADYLTPSAAFHQLLSFSIPLYWLVVGFFRIKSRCKNWVVLVGNVCRTAFAAFCIRVFRMFFGILFLAFSDKRSCLVASFEIVGVKVLVFLFIVNV